MTEYHQFGDKLPDTGTGTLPDLAASLLAACGASPAFTVLDRRLWTSSQTGLCDVLIVDCVNDQVPSRNEARIKVRERLALVLPRDSSKLPQARALRKSFPALMHLNHVPRGEPASLCLYFEPWTNARRTWTPERFLQRVLFWLAETAKGTLHRPDQPVEAMYFESPIDLILEPNWSERLHAADNVIAIAPIQRKDNYCTLRARVMQRAHAEQNGIQQSVALAVSVAPIVHAGVETFPTDLGELADGLGARGSALLEPLRAEVVRVVGSTGAARVDGQLCLLILSVPTKRFSEGPVERVDRRAFHMPWPLWKLGVDIGALSEMQQAGKHYPVTLLGSKSDVPPPTTWRTIPLVPISVRESVTRAFARSASGLSQDGSDSRRVLAGVGALGSSLADIWSREGWGVWTLVDPDFLQPHNIVRHIAHDNQIGFYKADIVRELVDANYSSSQRNSFSFSDDVLNEANAELAEALNAGDLIVDATTTLSVPRELSRRESVARCVSVFVTPSGSASVLLMDQCKRLVRLDELEAQYYGAVLSSDWGSSHLAGHNGELWVGAGCRDVSGILANEIVQLHAAILARQVRLLSSSEPPVLRIWISDHETSGVRVVDVPVQAPIRAECNAWTVVSHGGISAKLKRYRDAHLPRETGGIVIGYVDQPLKCIFIVDVLAAPADSEGSETGFVRGIVGLNEELERVKDETAGIVGYVGEWHSHPPFNPPRPSTDDIGLLAHCARTLAQDGVPALMLIIGSAGEISYSCGGSAGTLLTRPAV